jgi:ribosome assembly protein 3
MASVADAFSDDLEKIRKVRHLLAHPSTYCPYANLKEPSMTKSRLALLIDSLASGSEVFSSHAGERGETNEMEVVLNSNHDD